MEDVKLSRDLSEEELAAIEKWEELLVCQRATWSELLESTQEDARYAKAAYKNYRLSKGLLLFKPSFSIDAFCAPSRLRIQKYYEVQREALHIGSPKITASELQARRDATIPAQGRNYYTGSPLITPNLLPTAEIADLTAEWDGVYGFRSLFPERLLRLLVSEEMDYHWISRRGRNNVEEIFELSRDAVERRAWDRRLWLENDDCVLDTTPEDDMRQAEGLINPQNCYFRANNDLRNDWELKNDRICLWGATITAKNIIQALLQHQSAAPNILPAQNLPSQQPTVVAPPAAPNALTTQNLTSQQPAIVAPPAPPAPIVSRHGRPTPYTPTQQPFKISGVGTKHCHHRGNAPTGVDDATWIREFDNADSRVYARTIGSQAVKSQARFDAKNSGETRDVAIDKLIRLGILAAGFRDLNP
ncbi:hypothetical protein BKA65DRAFT_474245 [Rhexocercosporidium sp. MPI-PUGE-AT-0058]|nr:hypothetical protein BKA65DRAFT_474245 [Rhexocercosporidium sp. MPI-PUGE-AT-0058]